MVLVGVIEIVRAIDGKISDYIDPLHILFESWEFNMPGSCVAPGCNEGYGSKKSTLSFFSVPADPLKRAKWQAAIPRKDFNLKARQVVCEKHFAPQDIVRMRLLKDGDGNVIGESPYRNPKLAENAVPTLFPGCPSYISKRKPKPRQTSYKFMGFASPGNVEGGNKSTAVETCSGDSQPALSAEPFAKSPRMETFHMVYFDANIVALPPCWARNTPFFGPKVVIFSQFVADKSKHGAVTPILYKQVCFHEDCTVSCSVLGQMFKKELIGISSDPLQSINDLMVVLEKMDHTKICKGIVDTDFKDLKTQVGRVDPLGNVRHIHCYLSIADGDVCPNCCKLRRTFLQKLLRAKRKKCVEILRRPKNDSFVNHSRKHANNLRALSRAKARIAKLQEAHKAMDEIECKSLQAKLTQMNIPKEQVSVLGEIMNASQRKGPKGRRYSEDWILICMLFHIRSPAGYGFIRNQNILPLPSIRTIRRYLQLIDTSCGFDANFFELFKRKLHQKPLLKRHGILLWDEMSVRESISVRSTTLTYMGLTDFGEEGPKGDSVTEKATHVLVFMFQPLADMYTQPIAVFAAKGPVKGDMLAKLALKAIILLEKAGAKIHGFVSDGAATNRRMWSSLGIYGHLGNTNNSFEHPVDPKRRIFAFADTPHLIKNIRNRLFNNRELQVDPNVSPVKWDHFIILHNKDKELPGELRVCPKINYNHLFLSNVMKMRVKLATQIFSNSMVSGLKFYQSHKVVGLEDISGTLEFCKRVNDMFDALNRKIVFQGVQEGSLDFLVLQESLNWLDSWERKKNEGSIKSSQFLTSSTAEGLRITLISAMELIVYLKDFDFQYVLTGKINQDSLERFFGTIRQAAGANDHPAAVTALQLYKMLSVYSMLKPPKYGNCFVEDDGPMEPLVKISDIKRIYSKEGSESLIEELKEKLNGVIDTKDWEASEVIEHDYTMAPVVECVIYYVTGYLCKQILKHSKCSVCRAAIASSDVRSCAIVSELVNLKTEGKLIHPNINFYHFIHRVEECFVKHVGKADVFSATVDEIMDLAPLSFPCTEHKEEILAWTLCYYVNMRMRQWTRQRNREASRDYQHMKKTSKFCKS